MVKKAFRGVYFLRNPKKKKNLKSTLFLVVVLLLDSKCLY